MMAVQKRIVVAMSGGVDSSVAAALLKQQGWEVIGMMLRLWSEPGRQAFNRCCTPEAMALARRVAAQLDIPFYPIDIRDTFYENIVAGFIDGYAQGITPNPCLNCNRTIRFGVLLEHARAIGADFLATGHYARLQQDPEGLMHLLRGADPSKDQSYVLSVLSQQQLAQAAFPVGGFQKSEIRAMALDLGLPMASRPDSQDLCFLAGDDYRNFLHRHAPEINRPGMFLNQLGQRLGDHQGLAHYTIGQRKGLGVAFPIPLYVLDKNPADNTIILGTVEDLERDSLQVAEINWISGRPPTRPIHMTVQIRYRAREISAMLTPITPTSANLHLEAPLRGITPGQAAVFYQGDECLGGGLIQMVRSQEA
jgi:tRNA-specific 2-thiouridylase